MQVAEAIPGSLDVASILIGLTGGLALFLFGLDQMSDALKLIAGDGLRRVLAKLTTNRFTGAVAGALITAVIQSSSVTTVLVVGFISAGLMSLTQSIGVIMGANIGSTITAQLVAFKITHYALLLVAIGFFMFFASRRERVREYGHLIMGLGLIFFGMQLMSEGTEPLRTYEPFMVTMQQMTNPLVAIMMAALFTALVQSSSATTGLVITFASQGFISLETGIAFVFGANVGTCITAALAAIGKSRDALRAVLVHVIFNLTGVAIWLGLIPQLAVFVTWFSPASPELHGVARLAAETPRQIANAHTVFNFANTAVLIWFTTPLAWLVERLVPEKAMTDVDVASPKYLDPVMLQTPALAMDVVRMELGRLGAAALHMMRGAFTSVTRGSAREIHVIEALDNNVDSLYGAIVTYLGELSQQSLSDHQSKQVHDFLAAANYIESIGDMIETNLVQAGRERLRARLVISKTTEDVLGALNKKVAWAVERAVRAIVADDPEIGREVADAKEEINRLAGEAERHLSRRLSADEPNRLAMFRMESEIMEYLRRMYYFAKRIAKLVVVDETTPAEIPAEAPADTMAPTDDPVEGGERPRARSDRETRGGRPAT